MLEKAYGKSVLAKTGAFEWYKAFKEGREIVEDMLRSGRPSTSPTDENLEKVKEIVLNNRHCCLRYSGLIVFRMEDKRKAETKKTTSKSLKYQGDAN